MASISSPGVTSNTGFQAAMPSATVRVPPTPLLASSSGYCGGGVFTAATSVGGGGGGAGGSDAPQPARPVAANRDRLSRRTFMAVAPSGPKSLPRR
ncbi:hypothetical protein G6F24_018513 [Rhizopus arrhizus]|nr:hypothetical protein G6F24_018513 [Rhizopus arrhizus]